MKVHFYVKKGLKRSKWCKAPNGQESKLSNLAEGCKGSKWCLGLRVLKGLKRCKGRKVLGVQRVENVSKVKESKGV